MRTFGIITPRQLLIGLVAAAGWPLAMSRLLLSDFYAPLAVLSIGLLGATAVFYRERLKPWFPLSGKAILVGVSAGVVHSALTHAGYRLLSPVFPSLQTEVIGLYQLMGEGIGPYRALPIIVTSIVAEEVVWRGVLLEPSDASNEQMWVRGALSVVLYTVAQVGTGSWALALAAFACGWVWWGIRIRSGGLTAPIAMHLVWSLSVLVFVPLEQTP